MKLETFVDVMGINVIQVIERIQQRGDCVDQLLHPDDYLNPAWPQTYSKTSTCAQRSVHERLSDVAGREESVSPSNAILSTASKSENSNIIVCPSFGGNNETKDISKLFDTQRHPELLEVHTLSYQRRDKQGSNVCLKRIGDSQPDCKTGSQFAWRRPSSLRLPSSKEFIKDSLRDYSDAVKIINRGTRKIAKTDQIYSQSSAYDECTEIFSELLPPHVKFYNKFHS